MEERDKERLLHYRILIGDVGSGKEARRRANRVVGREYRTERGERVSRKGVNTELNAPE